MIEELAQVVAVNGDQIRVVSTIKSTCSGCQQLDNCGSGQVAKAFPQKKLELELACQLDAKVGDTVVIGLSEKLLLSTAWQVYLWPLIGLIVFGYIGQWAIEQLYLSSEIVAILFSILGGYLGFTLARKSQITLCQQKQLMPLVLRILPKNIPVTEITP